VGEHPDKIRRRVLPDDAQVQIIVGSLLGAGRIEGAPGQRCMRVAHEIARESYARWKYERLAALTADAPRVSEDGIAFSTIAHPIFDDLAALRRRSLTRLLAPPGLAVWMSDNGRIELRADVFVPLREAA